MGKTKGTPNRRTTETDPQGSHAAAGGRPEHRRPDGGTGLGYKPPGGWPAGLHAPPSSGPSGRTPYDEPDGDFAADGD